MGLAKGLSVTLRHMLRRSVTQQYPEVHPDLPARSRGVIALVEENCTSCMLCARECPDWCIYIDSHKETLPAPEGGRPRQRNVLDRFAIDFSLCMYCGICIEVCPFDALFWSPEFEYAEGDIGNMLHEKDRLTAWAQTVPPPPAHEVGAEPPKELSAAPRRPTDRPGGPRTGPGATRSPGATATRGPDAAAAQSPGATGTRRPGARPTSSGSGSTTGLGADSPAGPASGAGQDGPAAAASAPAVGDAAAGSAAPAGRTAGTGPSQSAPSAGGADQDVLPAGREASSTEAPADASSPGANSRDASSPETSSPEKTRRDTSSTGGTPQDTPSTAGAPQDESSTAGTPQDTPSTAGTPQEESSAAEPRANSSSTGAASDAELSTGSGAPPAQPHPEEQTSSEAPRRRRMVDPRSIRPPGGLKRNEPREPEEE